MAWYLDVKRQRHSARTTPAQKQRGQSKDETAIFKPEATWTKQRRNGNVQPTKMTSAPLYPLEPLPIYILSVCRIFPSQQIQPRSQNTTHHSNFSHLSSQRSSHQKKSKVPRSYYQPCCLDHRILPRTMDTPRSHA